jgi:single-strand DNA-binding protein
MASVNKVILIGNLGKDPEVKSFENGGKIAQFTMATTENWKDANGVKQSLTDWHNVVVRRTALAGLAEQYLKKGMSVYVEGKVRTRSYQSKEGETRYITEIICEEFTMLTPRGDGQNPNGNSVPQEAALAPSTAPDNDDLPF